MSASNTTTTPHSVKPSTLRVRRYRERRREGICSLTVEMPKADIEAIADGGLKPDYDAWDLLDAYYADVVDFYYADHLSDAALEWLIKNKVIKKRAARRCSGNPQQHQRLARAS